MNSIEIITKRFLESFDDTYNENTAREYETLMNDDGSFKDLSYDCESKFMWKNYVHFSRLTEFALGNRIDLVEKGIDFWFLKERKDRNWWQNDIGLPKKCAFLALYTKDLLKEETKEKFKNIFNDDVSDEWTGANRNWLIQNMFIRGLFLNDKKLIEKGKNYIESCVYISKEGEEGIQPDYSFAQHGTQLYSNGYGLSFLSETCKWVALFSGTDMAFSKESVQILSDMLLKGNRYMVYKGTIDFTTTGRNIVRSFGEYNNINGLIYASKILYEQTKNDEIKALSDFLEGKSETPGIEWTKYFPCLNFMSHFKKGYYASTRFGSKYVLGTDVWDGKIINGENIIAGFMGCFLTQYMVDGDEYKDVFPVWNWGHLPGVTSPDIELNTEKGAVMKTEFAGGIADGSYGVCGIDLKEGYDDVKFGGKKACFYFDNEIIQMGTKLYSNAKEQYNTTLNQCNLKGDVFADGKKLQKGEHKVKAKSIYHNKINYILNDEAVVKNEEFEGSVSKIRQVNQSDEELIKKELFSLYIPHRDNDSYLFAVLPNTNIDEGRNYEFPECVNRESVQAVSKNGTIMAVFYEKSELEISGYKISAEGPCFAIVKNGKADVKFAKGYKPTAVSVVEI